MKDNEEKWDIFDKLRGKGGTVLNNLGSNTGSPVLIENMFCAANNKII